MKVILCQWGLGANHMPQVQGWSRKVYGRAFYNVVTKRHEFPMEVEDYLKAADDIGKNLGRLGANWLAIPVIEPAAAVASAPVEAPVARVLAVPEAQPETPAAPAASVEPTVAAPATPEVSAVPVMTPAPAQAVPVAPVAAPDVVGKPEAPKRTRKPAAEAQPATATA